jgi:hypothetical protein
MSGEIIDGYAMVELNKEAKEKARELKAKRVMEIVVAIIDKIKDSLPLEDNEYVEYLVEKKYYFDVIGRLELEGYLAEIKDCDCDDGCDETHLGISLPS